VWTSPVPRFTGYRFYLAIIDDFTHYTWTFPIWQKYEVFPIVWSFLAYTKTQFRLPLISIQNDNGREFDSNTLCLLLSEYGVTFRLSCPYTSQQNEKAECILRTLNDCVRTLLIHSAAPPEFWAEALATTTHLVNRRPCRATSISTLFELLLGVPPHYGDLRVFGRLCYPNFSTTAPNKLSPRSVACVFIGYPTDHRCYRCFDIESWRVYTSRHIVFDDNMFPFCHAAPSPTSLPQQHFDDDSTPPLVLPQPTPRTPPPQTANSSPTPSVLRSSSGRSDPSLVPLSHASPTREMPDATPLCSPPAATPDAMETPHRSPPASPLAPLTTSSNALASPASPVTSLKFVEEC
jgi:hypothetical protein